MAKRETKTRKNEEVIETVRCALINEKRKVLLLKKASHSKNPGALEFPGGQMEYGKEEKHGKQSELKQQIANIVREVEEETGILLNKNQIMKVENFSYRFVFDKKMHVRKVHFFIARIKMEGKKVVINGKKNEKNETEDKHEGFIWAGKQELITLEQASEKSTNDRRKIPRLAKNSKCIKSLFKELNK